MARSWASPAAARSTTVSGGGTSMDSVLPALSSTEHMSLAILSSRWDRKSKDFEGLRDLYST